MIFFCSLFIYFLESSSQLKLMVILDHLLKWTINLPISIIKREDKEEISQ